MSIYKQSGKISGENTEKDGDCLSYISISLEELSFYNEYQGDDLLTQNVP